MSKLFSALEKQLKTENKGDAARCLKIYEKLKKLNSGHVWESQWNVLVNVRFEGLYPNNIKIYSLSAIGEIFLKGMECD